MSTASLTYGEQVSHLDGWRHLIILSLGLGRNHASLGLRRNNALRRQQME